MAPEGGAGGGGGTHCRPSNSRPRPRSPPAGPRFRPTQPGGTGTGGGGGSPPSDGGGGGGGAFGGGAAACGAALLSLIGNDISTIVDWGFRSPRGFVFVDAGGSDGASSFWGVGLGGGFGGCSAGVPHDLPPPFAASFGGGGAGFFAGRSIVSGPGAPRGAGSALNLEVENSCTLWLTGAAALRCATPATATELKDSSWAGAHAAQQRHHGLRKQQRQKQRHWQQQTHHGFFFARGFCRRKPRAQ